MVTCKGPFDQPQYVKWITHAWEGIFRRFPIQAHTPTQLRNRWKPGNWVPFGRRIAAGIAFGSEQGHPNRLRKSSDPKRTPHSLVDPTVHSPYFGVIFLGLGVFSAKGPGLKPVSLENPRQDTSVAAEVVSHTAHMGGAFSGLLLGILITRSSHRWICFFERFFLGPKPGIWGRGCFSSSSSSFVAWVFPFRLSLRKTKRKLNSILGVPCFQIHTNTCTLCGFP